jgi:uncharacterized protein
MLPVQLLRARIKNRGKNIDPLFCEHTIDDDRGNGYEIHLASKLIEEFEEAWKNKERNGVLADRIGLLEEQYGDYKLVRGFYTLLQRRCILGSKKSTATETSGSIAKSSMNSRVNQNIPGLGHQSIDPFSIRRELFEESSKRGFALTDFERTEIMDAVASRLGISMASLSEAMWSDLEDNLIIEHFFKITPKELVGWYNLSLIQTLLFNCTELEFSVSGGSNWKRVLRDLKRLGLMYHLEQRQQVSREQKETYLDDKVQQVANCLSAVKDDATTIVCSVNGPLSIFKLTDRYGTSIAKLLPSIISTDKWFISAWIVRKNLTSGKRVYEFELSYNRSPLLLREPIRDRVKISSLDQEIVSGSTDITSNTYYDSKVEENFAKRFIQSGNGWSLIREPDPIILSNGKALIPDFLFEKYGKRIYLEIVGFWTKEYLEKKFEKIRDVSVTETTNRVDFLIAVNSDYHAASSNVAGTKVKLGTSQLSNFIQKNHLIMYKNDSVPLRPILEYLKYIEQRIEQQMVSQYSKSLLGELDHIIEVADPKNSIISVEDIAKKYNISIEAALRIIRSEAEIDENKKENENYDKDGHTKFIIVGKYLILDPKANELKSLLEKTTRYNEASILFMKNGIPEECHLDLISKLGFNIIWKGIDYNTATIEKKYS